VENEPLHAFGEIELQLLKGVTNGNKTVSTATHELLGYIGRKEEIEEVAKSALAIDTVPELY
jgi:hypothetical protein